MLKPESWRRCALLLLSLPVLVPILWLVLAWADEGQAWPHLRTYVLPDAIAQTCICLIGVALLTALLGGGLGWIQARYEFPFRKVLDTLLILPLALPGFVVAFVWVGLGQKLSLNVQGPVWAILVYSSCLFPYVFVLARQSAASLNANLTDSLTLFGLNVWQRLTLLYGPMLLPALRLGVLLALMETLADFGAANVLGLQTLTTSVYKTWFGLQDLRSATQLASLCALLMLGLLALEARALRKRTDSTTAGRAWVRKEANGAMRWILPLASLSVVGLSLILPVAQLAIWAWNAGSSSWPYWFASLRNSLTLSLVGSVIVIAFGLCFALLERQQVRDVRLQKWTLYYGLGYGIAGTVLAVAMLLSASALGVLGKVLMASPLLLVLAYWARFARLGASPFIERLAQLSPNLSDAARIHGLGAWARFRTLYLPTLSPIAASALLLVFVEILKELPATLVLRPIGWDTLAVKIYGYASEGLWQLAAMPSLVLVAISGGAIVLLRKQTIC
jgi:iron(III) transport system permease protein